MELLFAKVTKKSRNTKLQDLFPVYKHKLFKQCVHVLESMLSPSHYSNLLRITSTWPVLSGRLLCSGNDTVVDEVAEQK